MVAKTSVPPQLNPEPGDVLAGALKRIMQIDPARQHVVRKHPRLG